MFDGSFVSLDYTITSYRALIGEDAIATIALDFVQQGIASILLFSDSHEPASMDNSLACSPLHGHIIFGIVSLVLMCGLSGMLGRY